MPKITYNNEYGSHEVDVNIGASVMTGAVQNGIDGIVAECGGSCACATCHVYVDESFLEKLPEMGSLEDEMLECTESKRESNSRLSCQMKVTEVLDGLSVNIPPAQ